jgi:hypothetical protein
MQLWTGIGARPATAIPRMSGDFEGPRGVLEHRPHLLQGDTREPRDEVGDLGAVREVLEERRDRHARGDGLSVNR